ATRGSATRTRTSAQRYWPRPSGSRQFRSHPLFQTLLFPQDKGLRYTSPIRIAVRWKTGFHYSIHTERSYVEWIIRFVRFHGMRSRADLLPAEPKIEPFLTDLAVHGHV